MIRVEIVDRKGGGVPTFYAKAYFYGCCGDSDAGGRLLLLETRRG
jgi:hypothetical protein